MSDLPSVKTVHKAIRNYLVNEIGVTRETVEKAIREQVGAHISRWINVELATDRSFLRNLLVNTITKLAEQHLRNSLTVALSKVECKAEIVIVDGRMNDPG